MSTLLRTVISVFTFLMSIVVSAQPEKAPAGEADGASAKRDVSDRPNVILIMADDLGYGSLGCYGGRDFQTPHIDKLAASGMRFTDFHSNGPVCSPTRAALMTGRYPQRCAWVSDDELSPVFREQRRQNPAQRWAWGIDLREITIASLMREAGYRTGLIGKWHLGYDVRFHPMNYGFDEFRGFIGGNVDYHSHVAGYGLKQLDWWSGREIKNETGYTTDLLSRYATDFISQNKGQPFFLYLAHGAPHDPWQGRAQGKKKSPQETYQEMIRILDESVGAVTNEIRKHGLEKNTLLIFCSDNGAAAPRGVSANGHLQGKKTNLLEGGHRVPFMAVWPGTIEPGSISEQTAMTMDLPPTFVRLAGAKVPAAHQLDGADLMGVLCDKTSLSDRTLHWRFGDDWAVRKGPWKLTGREMECGALINLNDDIEEKSNRLKEHTKLADELFSLHQTWTAEVGDR